MVAVMRGSVMAWRCMSAAMVVVMLMVMVCLGCGATVVESARPMSARETVAAIEQRAGASTTLATSEADDGWSSETAAAASNEDGVEFSGGGGGVDPAWDVEAESPPAQRQRDRSLWGMSKRLVPTGPNPLHN